MERRRFLTLLASATATATAGCTVARTPVPSLSPGHPPAAMPVAQPRLTEPKSAREVAQLLPPPPPSTRIPLPGGGALTRLPGAGDMLALTVDDGANAEVVRAYAQFAKDSGLRMTFFVTGSFPGWTQHVGLLRPLVESGQVQLGNHTWTHPWLTRLSAKQVAEELGHNGMFLRNTYGLDGTPYYRPPFGAHNAQVDRVAADLGYHAATMWYGSLADSGPVREDFIVKMAHEYLNPQAIVIGHANHPPVTHVYPQLLEIIRTRNLRTVTLNDVFLPPGGKPVARLPASPQAAPPVPTSPIAVPAPLPPGPAAPPLEKEPH